MNEDSDQIQQQPTEQPGPPQTPDRAPDTGFDALSQPMPDSSTHPPLPTAPADNQPPEDTLEPWNVLETELPPIPTTHLNPHDSPISTVHVPLDEAPTEWLSDLAVKTVRLENPSNPASQLPQDTPAPRPDTPSAPGPNTPAERETLGLLREIAEDASNHFADDVEEWSVMGEDGVLGCIHEPLPVDQRSTTSGNGQDHAPPPATTLEAHTQPLPEHTEPPTQDVAETWSVMDDAGQMQEVPATEPPEPPMVDDAASNPAISNLDFDPDGPGGSSEGFVTVPPAADPTLPPDALPPAPALPAGMDLFGTIAAQSQPLSHEPAPTINWDQNPTIEQNDATTGSWTTLEAVAAESEGIDALPDEAAALQTGSTSSSLAADALASIAGSESGEGAPADTALGSTNGQAYAEQAAPDHEDQPSELDHKPGLLDSALALLSSLANRSVAPQEPASSAVAAAQMPPAEPVAFKIEDPHQPAAPTPDPAAPPAEDDWTVLGAEDLNDHQPPAPQTTAEPQPAQSVDAASLDKLLNAAGIGLHSPATHAPPTPSAPPAAQMPLQPHEPPGPTPHAPPPAQPMLEEPLALPAQPQPLTPLTPPTPEQLERRIQPLPLKAYFDRVDWSGTRRTETALRAIENAAPGGSLSIALSGEFTKPLSQQELDCPLLLFFRGVPWDSATYDEHAAVELAARGLDVVVPVDQETILPAVMLDLPASLFFQRVAWTGLGKPLTPADIASLLPAATALAATRIPPADSLPQPLPAALAAPEPATDHQPTTLDLAAPLRLWFDAVAWTADAAQSSALIQPEVALPEDRAAAPAPPLAREASLLDRRTHELDLQNLPLQLFWQNVHWDRAHQPTADEVQLPPQPAAIPVQRAALTPPPTAAASFTLDPQLIQSPLARFFEAVAWTTTATAPLLPSTTPEPADQLALEPATTTTAHTPAAARSAPTASLLVDRDHPAIQTPLARFFLAVPWLPAPIDPVRQPAREPQPAFADEMHPARLGLPPSPAAIIAPPTQDLVAHHTGRFFQKVNWFATPTAN